MKFIIKMHPEITIKSKSVRKRFTQLLNANIRQICKQNGLSVDVRNQWDKLVMLVNPASFDQVDTIVSLLQSIPGVDQFLQVEESPYQDLEDIYQQVKAVWHDKLAGKTFCVRVKRRGKHNFSSTDIAAYVGGGLNQHCESNGVKLKHPDICIQLEVENDTLIQVKARHAGLGGMPLPTQEDVLSLMSGGFDSGVASYLTIRRGARTHFCFFNLGGRDHEIGVRQVSYYLWKKFSASHRVKFIAVDFEPVVTEILEKVDNGQMGVVLKRMMMRAASKVADNLQIKALVTGESLGQVSSQTLTNLTVIDQATSKLILRPLICMDKSDIIDIAREIGTEDFAKTMPEYCGVISKKPTVRAELSRIEAEEAKFDMGIIDRVVRQANTLDIRSIAEQTEREVSAVASFDKLPDDAIVVDIRAPEEEESKPLEVEGHTVKHLPFYRLATKFGDLDQSKDYYLYCEKGVMSQLQALLLHEHGYANVNVYRPIAPGKRTAVHNKATNMVQLIYISLAQSNMDRQELLDLLQDCRENNREQGITGILLHHERNFLQVLEGQESAVDSLYEKIKQDPRHSNCLLLNKADIEARDFASWSMGFYDLTEHDLAKNPGLNAFMTVSGTPSDIATFSVQMQDLLQQFKEAHASSSELDNHQA